MKAKDDYDDWEVMYSHYKQHMDSLQSQNTIFLKEGRGWVDKDRNIKIDPGLRPLHINWRSVYEVILRLGAQSVFEIGYGFGHNLNNLQVLSPGMKVCGIEVSERMHAHAIGMLPHLKDNLLVGHSADYLNPRYNNSADIAFSRGVIMFLTRHMEIIHNMFLVAKEQVVMLEGWTSHEYYKDIQAYAQSDKFPWPELHMYCYDAEIIGKDKPRVMICSRTPIEGEWVQPLTSDHQLRNR